MAAIVASNFAVAAPSKVAVRSLSAKKAVALPVKRSVAVKAVRAQPVASLKTEKLTAAVTVGTAAALANPLVAEAAITPSLKNTLLSVVAGGIVLAAIGVAVVGVSTFDKVSRK
ncbi:photosystem II PsbX protein, chloroplast precursor [Micromonas pusilla CCMP1545]|uniref:Photosystem II PsbX protein, chloroplast n=2 Tax=Micromonas pusilla TaxID=38833 RepID=C1N1X7_MICPC|nr:photosystem II PsbX protein, chloroplast precursor [Micromonas pusilla CCMP1545]EEH53907.1 photosystem II PsbX protein, chloroplast precursor [Micromonas pusilla CCMP1545]|mmetsp:Transcript_6165/g.22580  ORF Transcript_6165/g.22580 Transcript_6165/m.22580 type:complete len:114 (+) Transcript_6165:69-410(+)|eukprot:XP_003062195.1 photosystem II PsbX protein, chloroplast precursor [Micromonas pusilla CCMP1545]